MESHPSLSRPLKGRGDSTGKVTPTGKIAFDSDRDGNLEIYMMNADGTGQTRLTNDSAYDSFPAWSPDGSRIAFGADRGEGRPNIYVMSADGVGQTGLTTDPAQDGVPAWSPDGSKIAFLSNRDGNWDIYVMNADGTGQTRLTTNLAGEFRPTWWGPR